MANRPQASNVHASKESVVINSNMADNTSSNKLSRKVSPANITGMKNYHLQYPLSKTPPASLLPQNNVTNLKEDQVERDLSVDCISPRKSEFQVHAEKYLKRIQRRT
jgi:hypothetical protein